MLKTILNPLHHQAGARMVPFGGWEMPLHYGSQLEEHHAVRNHAGLFDVSHMTVVDLRGDRAQAFLRRLLANDVARLKTPGQALYSCMLRDDGGILDDLIVWFGAPDRYRLVVNAATTDKDLAWIGDQAKAFDVAVEPRRDLGMIAVQGPQARHLALPHLPAVLQASAQALEPFTAAEDAGWFVSRTGYTGEDGFEIMLPADQAADLWEALTADGVRPCGLGARDTLRLEAGLNLYGTDMDESVTPLESGLGWTVNWDDPERDFIGRRALEAQRAAGPLRRFTGLVLEGKGVLRNHLPLFDETRQVGEITSGGYSPTMGRAIALARLAPDAGAGLTVEIRGRRLPVRVVEPPFVRHGTVRVET